MAAAWVFRPAHVNLKSLVENACVKALKDTAEEVATRAADTAPYNTGFLAGSVGTDMDRDALKAAIGFDSPTAVAAHENMHDQLQDGRRPKFLEMALHEKGEALAATAAVELRKVLR